MSLQSLYFPPVSVIKLLVDHPELVKAWSYTVRWVCRKPQVFSEFLQLGQSPGSCLLCSGQQLKLLLSSFSFPVVCLRATWNLPEHMPPGPVKNLKEFTLVFECSPTVAQSLPEFSLWISSHSMAMNFNKTTAVFLSVSGPVRLQTSGRSVFRGKAVYIWISFSVLCFFQGS